MARLREYTSYANAHRHFSSAALREPFESIAHRRDKGPVDVTALLFSAIEPPIEPPKRRKFAAGDDEDALWSIEPEKTPEAATVFVLAFYLWRRGLIALEPGTPAWDCV